MARGRAPLTPSRHPFIIDAVPGGRGRLVGHDAPGDSFTESSGVFVYTHMPHYDDITKLVSILCSMRESFDHHGPAVAQLAKQMCIVLDIPPEESKLIEVGGYLHDIGKLRMNAELFNHPRKLTQNEREQVQLHAPLGWAIVEQAGYDRVILNIVRHHHENWDGSGYPDGLQGDDIPREARIVQLCDVYQSMTHKRSYHDRYTHEFTREFMEQGRETRYDPDLLDVFFSKVVTHE